MLKRALATEPKARYLCVETAEGQVVAHTFGDGYPASFPDLWRENRGQLIRFRTADEHLLDLSAPVLGGQLGTIHVGLSRGETVRAIRRLTWGMSGALGGMLLVVLLIAHLVATRVSRPLRQLEASVLSYPEKVSASQLPQVSGTHEVESLARSFSVMANRLESLERDRQAAQERLIHTERLAAFGEVAAGLAHEIRNPVDGMLECVRYLQTDPEKNARAEKYYPMLNDGLQRIANVMQGMLSFVRSGEGGALRPHSVWEMVDRLKTLVEAQTRESNVRLEWKLPGGCACMCDRDGLSQAALNLVLNAVEAAEPSSDPRVVVDSSCDSQWVYFSVDDNGPGVSDEMRDRIFEPFFTTKPIGKGTGLGLAVSRDLIRAAGGELELASGRGSRGGARFVIRLPRACSPEEYDEGTTSENPCC